MHAFLINSKDPLEIQKKASEISKKLRAKLVGFNLKKIEDVRHLNKLTRLTVTEPTAYFIENVEMAGEEALSAFLKNLEEPQSNLYYILTTANLSQVLPTVISRCQVIRIKNHELGIMNEEIEKFGKMDTSEKLGYVDKIRDREVATKFLEDFIETAHRDLHDGKTDLSEISANIKVATTALIRLKANGNVTLQLANFVVNLV